jgi:hypothetical protein
MDVIPFLCHPVISLNLFLCRVIIDWRKEGNILREKQRKGGAPS